MRKLHLSKTDVTPEVVCDFESREMVFRGDSRPENTSKFYSPVLDWVEELGKYVYWYKTEYNSKYRFTVKFHLDYVSSSSLKYIFDILKKLEQMKSEFEYLGIDWYYDPGDEDMKENGEEFSTMISLPFRILCEQ